MPNPTIETVQEHIAWSYANLARAAAALEENAVQYNRVHHIIRTKLYYGLINGTMKMRSLYDDERLKMIVPQACYYCGSADNLSVDHLIPRVAKGTDDSDNLIWACKSCNSSKQGSDMLEWMEKKEMFPPVLLLRRYLKLVARYCDDHGLLSLPLSEALERDLLFNLSLIPHIFPPLTELKLWISPENSV